MLANTIGASLGCAALRQEDGALSARCVAVLGIALNLLPIFAALLLSLVKRRMLAG